MWIPKTKETPDGKEDWEVTQAEYVEYGHTIGSTLPRDLLIVGSKGAHRMHVKLALKLGKPVPDKVLADYPDLSLAK